jgi:hypothetical protein
LIQRHRIQIDRSFSPWNGSDILGWNVDGSGEFRGQFRPDGQQDFRLRKSQDGTGRRSGEDGGNGISKRESTDCAGCAMA